MEAFITINCSNYSDNIIDIINLFQEIGWEIYNSKGEIEFLPIGDDDKYDWQREKMSVENFYEIVSKKHFLILPPTIGCLFHHQYRFSYITISNPSATLSA